MPLKFFNYYFDFTIKSSSLSFRFFRNYNISLPKFLIIDKIFKGKIFTLISLLDIVVRQAVLVKNHVILAVLRFRSYSKGCGLLYITCGNYIRKLVFL
jgi:hypothetical protein